MSANSDMRNNIIRHMIMLERYKSHEAKRILKILESEILPDINRKLEKRLSKIIERGIDSGPATTARLKELEREILILTQEMSGLIKGELLKNVSDIASHEYEWQARTLKQTSGIVVDTVLPGVKAFENIVKKTSFAGLTLDNWFDTLSRSTQRQIMVAVNRGILEGETTPQIISRVRGTKAAGYSDGVYNSTRAKVQAVVRTTINHVSTRARHEFFVDNKDLIKSLQWVSTLDSRTSVICAGLDGKVFPIDKGPRPPAHVNCRSAMVAVLKSAKEIGLDDIPEGKRASIDGQVPASTTYGEWLRGQSIETQNEVLGVARAKLFRLGKLPIEKFTDSNLRPLSLDELRKTERKAFEAAGL